MKENRRQWLSAVPWETVLTVNQTLCQAQKTTHQSKEKAADAARRLWEKAIPQTIPLSEVLDICRRCYELAPFTFNNGNTFAAIGRTLVEEDVKKLPPVEAQIVRTTVSHYIAGQVGKKELLQILRHFEAVWKTSTQPNVDPSPSKVTAIHAAPAQSTAAPA